MARLAAGEREPAPECVYVEDNPQAADAGTAPPNAEGVSADSSPFY